MERWFCLCLRVVRGLFLPRPRGCLFRTFVAKLVSGRVEGLVLCEGEEWLEGGGGFDCVCCLRSYLTNLGVMGLPPSSTSSSCSTTSSSLSGGGVQRCMTSARRDGSSVSATFVCLCERKVSACVEGEGMTETCCIGAGPTAGACFLEGVLWLRTTCAHVGG